MADKFMYIPNDDTQITPSVDYNSSLNRLATVYLRNQPIKIQLKVPKVVDPTNKKTL